MKKFWLGIVSKEHVLNGVQGGFAMVCHGKGNPLKRMKAGDGLIYYSPTIRYGEKEPCKSFTAIGRIKTGEVYQVALTPTFHPFKMDVEYFSSSQNVPVQELMNKLELTQNPNWGYQLRLGLIPISQADFLTIAEAMGAKID